MGISMRQTRSGHGGAKRCREAVHALGVQPHPRPGLHKQRAGGQPNVLAIRNPAAEVVGNLNMPVPRTNHLRKQLAACRQLGVNVQCDGSPTTVVVRKNLAGTSPHGIYFVSQTSRRNSTTRRAITKRYLGRLGPSIGEFCELGDDAMHVSRLALDQLAGNRSRSRAQTRFWPSKSQGARGNLNEFDARVDGCTS